MPYLLSHGSSVWSLLFLLRSASCAYIFILKVLEVLFCLRNGLVYALFRLLLSLKYVLDQVGKIGSCLPWTSLILERVSEEGVYGSWERNNSESNRGLQADGLCSAGGSFPENSLDSSILQFYRTLWIAHLLQIKSPVFYLHINSVIYPGSLLIIPWISISWPWPPDS